MIKRTRLIARFNDLAKVDRALLALEKARFTRDEVSFIRQAKPEDARKIDPRPDAKTGTDVVAGFTGGAIGLGMVGGFLSSATLVGPLLVAGPIGAAVAGGLGGGLAAALRQDKSACRSLDKAVARGEMLLIVDDVDHRVADATELVQTCDPVEIIQIKDASESS